MATWADLKAAIDLIITTNGNNEITGALLNQVLDSVIDNVGKYSTFKGIAIPATIPGTEDGPVFYMAAVGVYPNFNGIEVFEGEFAVLIWNGTSWSKEILGVGVIEVGVVDPYMKEYLKGVANVGTDNSQLWLISPKAQYFNGNTYVVFIDFTDNKRKIGKYNHETDIWDVQTWIQTSFVGGGNTTNKNYAHAAPSIHITDDGYINLGYTGYAQNTVYFIRSTNPEDITAFNAEKLVEDTGGSGSQSYPTILDKNGTLVYFFRGHDGSSVVLSRAISVDNGLNWTNIIHITDHYPYYQVRKDLNGRIHIAWHDQVGGVNKDLLYIYSDDAEVASPSWKVGGGAAISIPIAIASTARLFDSDADGWDDCYLLGCETDNNGDVHIFGYATNAVDTAQLLYFKYNAGWIKSIFLTEDLSASTAKSNIQGDLLYRNGALMLITEYITDPDYETEGKAEIKEYISLDNGDNWIFSGYVTRETVSTVANPFYIRNSRNIAWFEGSRDYGVGKAIKTMFR